MNDAALTVVIGSWIAFGVLMLLLRRKQDGPASRKDPVSLAGIALQSLAYALVWSARRARGTPILGRGALVEGGLALLASAIAVASVWFAVTAIRTLGRQWSLQARVLEGHRLVSEGPYSLVRHPIYTAMLGMLVATGLVSSRPEALLVGIGFYLAGTAVRIRAEERLLRAAFGPEFEEYRRKVPALLPGATRPER